VSSPAEIPHADEALKSLVTRFKASPAEAFIELSAALLARGHASEALRVAEHGLQIAPTSVEGRIERAASLLAMGRPRVAYVELRRALAIDPSHRRAMRLLGKAFVESGAPSRAADLLAKRSMHDDTDETKPEKPPTPPPAPPPKSKFLPPPADTKPLPAAKSTPPGPPPREQSIPDLFSALTKDLGLGGAVPETPVRRVEVTQIIRRKGPARGPRSPSELAAIDGPIVDTTQPGHIEAQNVDEIDAIAPPIAAPLFDRATTDQFHMAGFALGEDEPLFQDDMPFEVRPVDADEPASRAPTVPTGKPPAARPKIDDSVHTESEPSEIGDTVVDAIEQVYEPLEDVSTQGPAPLSSSDRATPAAPIPAALDFEDEQTPLSPVPVVERKRAQRTDESPRLEVIDPKPKQAHVALAIAGAVAIILYTVVLLWASYDTMRVWLPGEGAQPQRADESRTTTAHVP
jgi:hypothetical protein